MSYQYLNQQATFSGDAVLASTYYDDAVIAGKAYIVETVFQLAASATTYIEINPKAMVDKRLTVMPTGWGIDASFIRVTLGICSSCSAGTTVSFLNRNYFYGTSNPAQTTLRLNAIPTTPVDSSTQFVIGTAVQGVNLGGGTSQAGGIQILDPTLDYYFKVSNQSSTVTLVTLNVNIFETPVDEFKGF